MRVNSTSIDNPLVTLEDQAIEIVGIGKQLHGCRAPRHAEFLNIDPTGFSSAGYADALAKGKAKKMTQYEWLKITFVDPTRFQ